MLPSLSHIGSLQSIKDAAAATPAAGKPGQFASLLDNAIQSIEKPGNEANQAVQNLLGGGNEELHNVAAATTRADLAFELGLQVRNKIISAYQEVMKMQM
jgi:flagellar hook-basal body complex protein FliE